MGKHQTIHWLVVTERLHEARFAGGRLASARDAGLEERLGVEPVESFLAVIQSDFQLVTVVAIDGFAADGRGTPAPTAPTERLVVGGPYRYVRNPMYLAVGAVIAGQALLLASLALLVYLAVFAVAVVLFVKIYEEPTLRATFGAEYEAYCAEVPAWWPKRPRLTKW